MKVKTLQKILEDFDENDSVKVDQDGCLLIGGRGGYIVRLPITTKKKRLKEDIMEKIK